MDIENKLCPNNGKLILDENGFSAKIVDAELDIVKCEFESNCVKLDASKYKWLTLSRENLKQLLKLLDQSELIE